MTANSTVDIYWQNRIYQGCDAMYDNVFITGKCTCKNCKNYDNEYMAKRTSYQLIGSHNFTDGQPVVLGKDYELKPNRQATEWGNGYAGQEHGKGDIYPIVAVPLAPQSEQEQEIIDAVNKAVQNSSNDKEESKSGYTAETKEDFEQLKFKHFQYPPSFTNDEVKYFKDIAEGHCPEFIQGNARLDWIEGALNMAYHLTKQNAPTPAADTVNKTEGERPAVKAKELVNKLYQPLGFLSCNVSSGKMWDYSKERAIENIDEEITLLKILLTYPELKNNFFIVDEINDLQQIRSEIEKL